MSRYLNDAIQVYLDEMIDWESLLRMSKGEEVDVEAEKAALQEVLETAAAICSEIEPAAREGWDQASRLEDGEVIYPPHIQAGYDKLREAGLVAFGVREEYGGFGLPAFAGPDCRCSGRRAGPASGGGHAPSSLAHEPWGLEGDAGTGR